MQDLWKLNTTLFAEKIRLESIRSMGSSGGGHVGGVLSSAELLAVLYQDQMNINVNDPMWDQRDRLVLSKGHCGPVLYSTLALKGFFPIELLCTLNKNGTMLPSHCNMYDTPGVDVGTGSLGQGASIATGIALGLKMKKQDSYTFLILGDGECDEGQVWEMALLAPQLCLNNLIAFVDYNKQQLDGYTKDIIDLGDLRNKFDSFGWNAIEVDGHDVTAIKEAILSAKNEPNRPSMIVLNTIKGKGWSKTEFKEKVHHIPLSKEDIKNAENEIGLRIHTLENEMRIS